MRSINRSKTLFKEWEQLLPMASDDEKRLWEKLRLEWNYHSNHIEGNTLTYGETELLFLHDQAVGDHHYRDYLEMKAHDLAIKHLRMLVGEDRIIGETDIRDLNQILLKEPFFKPAITPDGQATRNEIIPGKYKILPNNVQTKEGNIFKFVAPEDVSNRMERLVERLHREFAFPDFEVIPFIAWLHHEFVLIHPFGDGNGRTARLLVNYVLMRKGYPPLVVPTEKKDSYFAALRLADNGNLDKLAEFLGECACQALELGIRAAKGSSIEEPNDLEKEIELFKRRHGSENNDVIVKSKQTIKMLYRDTLKPLFESFLEAHEPLKDLFSTFVARRVDAVDHDSDWEQAIGEWLEATHESNLDHLGFEIALRGFKSNKLEPFEVLSQIYVLFAEYHYEIFIGDNEEIANRWIYSKSYTENLTPSEINSVSREGVSRAFDVIKSRAE